MPAVVYVLASVIGLVNLTLLKSGCSKWTTLSLLVTARTT